jgi:hypothetical protein
LLISPLGGDMTKTRLHWTAAPRLWDSVALVAQASGL